MFNTYLHRRNDTGAVFYIGKGILKRAWAKAGRNKHWKNIVAKCGYTVEVLAQWPTEVQAFEHEKFLIACFRDLGAPLCNLTDGGDGISGLRHTDETRAKMSAAHLGKSHSIEHRAKISAAKRGQQRSPETRAKISTTKKQRGGMSAEARAAVAAANALREWSVSSRELQAAHSANRTHSAETRTKMSQARICAWANPAYRAAQMQARKPQKL